MLVALVLVCGILGFVLLMSGYAAPGFALFALAAFAAVAAVYQLWTSAVAKAQAEKEQRLRAKLDRNRAQQHKGP